MKVRCKWDCDNGWYREPDGYGCVQWTTCGPCNGTGFMEETSNVDRQKEILGNGSQHQPAGVRPAATAASTRKHGRVAKFSI